MARIESLLGDRPSAEVFARRYLANLAEILDSIDTAELARFVQVLLEARQRGARIFFLGNGGSAATASHFVNDLTIGTGAADPPFRAVSLADNHSVLTAIGNDLGYQHVFARQLQIHLSPGDVVVAISASGNSPNILHAIEFANETGAVTVGLTGFDGGALRSLVTCAVHVPTDRGQYGPVEDAHMVLDHLVTAFLCDVLKRS